MKRVWFIVLLLFVIFLALQFFRPSLGNPPVTGDLQAPPEVKAVLQRACYDCHSNQTQLRWYDRVVPAYWQVAGDVKAARAVLNFSNWDRLNKTQQKGKFFEAIMQIEQHGMPLGQYALLHHGAVVTADEIGMLKQYALTLVYRRVLDTVREREAAREFAYWLRAVGPATAKDAPNGIAYGPQAGYPGWQVISTNDRFDYGYTHVILGNAVAVQAIREGQVNPYPDGAVLVKPQWDDLPDSSGEILSGAFSHVDMMIRDGKKYAATFGWGFARWLGPGLTPYGKDASFVNECVNCHRPMKNRGYTFTLPYNDSLRVGSSADGFVFPLRGKLVTFYVDPAKKTMSTLYSSGAVRGVGGYSDSNGAAGYPAGAVLSLVTWTQQDDVNWFGGRIPQTMISVEQVRIGAGGKPEYTSYSGAGLLPKEVDAHQIMQRVSYMLGKKPSVMP